MSQNGQRIKLNEKIEKLFLFAIESLFVFFYKASFQAAVEMNQR